jgi:DHA2 family multidrug resistance protein
MADDSGFTQPTDAAYPPDQVPLSTWVMIFGVMLGAFMAILDIQITNSSLKEIQGALGATLEEGSWISTSYLVAEIIVIPLTGWLTQVFTLRNYLFVNTCLFLLFSVLCALAWDLPAMIVFRACQGFTGGVLIPLAFTALLVYLPASQRAKGMALFTLTATFAPSIGPTIGGWLTDNLGWQYIFYLNLLPGLFVLLSSWFNIKREPMRLEMLKTGDWFGIICMAIGLGCLDVVLEEGNRKDWFGSALIVRLTIIGVLFLSLFLIRQLTAQKPLLNLRLLKRRNFGMGAMINITLGLGLYGSVYILPLYLAQIQNFSALQIGEVIMWLGVPQLFIIPFTPLLLKYFDPRWLVALGTALFSASCFMNATLIADTPVEHLHVTQIIRALGQPLIFAPLTTLISMDIPGEDSGSGSSLFNMMRNLGGSIGIAALSTLLTNREQLHSVRIGESVSLASLATQERLEQLSQAFIAKGLDPYTAQQFALKAIDNIVRRESFVMAFNDCFLFMGFALLASAFALFFMRRPSGETSAETMVH